MESEGREVDSLGIPASHLGGWVNNSATKRTNRRNQQTYGKEEDGKFNFRQIELEGHCVWTEERDWTHQCVSGD